MLIISLSTYFSSLRLCLSDSLCPDGWIQMGAQSSAGVCCLQWPNVPLLECSQLIPLGIPEHSSVAFLNCDADCIHCSIQ